MHKQLADFCRGDSTFVFNRCSDEDDLFTSLILEAGRQVIIYELPDPLEIPDPVLQRHAGLPNPISMICLGDEEVAISMTSAKLPIEFLCKKELSPAVCLSTMRNLLARCDAYIALNQSQAQLAITQQELSASELGTAIAHDAKNMIGAVIGHLQLLANELGPEQEERTGEHLRSALAGCQHISSVLHQWKNSHNANGGKLERPKAVPLTELLLEMETIVSPLIPERITLSLDVSEECEVLGSRHQLEQAILNFILNAVQATPNRGTVHVATAKVEEDGQPFCAITIEDQGKGIPEENLTNIFNPFFTSNKKRGGTGLGLAMVNKIIHEHGGHIAVKSTVGKGTCFTVHLPLHIPMAPPENRSNEVQGSLGRVVVIDDTTALLDIMSDFLEEYGMSAETFSNPKDALEWSKNHSDEIDLIVLDLQLPEISGRDCFFHYRDLVPEVPIVVYSGSKDQDVDELLRNGAAQFFEKPLDYEATMRWIRETVLKHKRHRFRSTPSLMA
ncbi:MAG: response regulator [Bdellovibrionales bacterium]|nr:response regulator [Bdellovibrionales bacterium]